MAVKRLSLAIFNNEMKICKRNKVYMVKKKWNIKLNTMTESGKGKHGDRAGGEKNDYQHNNNGRNSLEIMIEIYFKHFLPFLSTSGLSNTLTTFSNISPFSSLPSIFRLHANAQHTIYYQTEVFSNVSKCKL